MNESLTDTPELDDLCEAVLTEFRRRLRAGEPVLAEEILAANPTLAHEPGYAVQIVLEEFQGRRRRGDEPTVEEYAGRFPLLAQHIPGALRVELLMPDRTEPVVSESPTVIHYPVPGLSPDVQELSATYERLDLPELGRGGMGVVLPGAHRGTGEAVAIKILRAGHLASPAERIRFAREMKVMPALDHPGVVRVLAVGAFESEPAYVMPLYPGGSLAHTLPKYREPRRAVSLLLEVARAMGAAHARGIIHRDLKPGNILLAEDGSPVIADFGLARVLGEGEVTGSNEVMGTHDYMSPEQAQGKSKRVGPEADVWSLGVVLHVLLTGEKPAAAGSTPSTRSRRPPADHVAPPGAALPPGLRAIIRGCLRSNPADRYPSAGSLADDLDRWLQGKRPLGPRPGRTRGWLLAAAALLLGVLVGGAVYLGSLWRAASR